jgi:AcrR family transcriptional regulator
MAMGTSQAYDDDTGSAQRRRLSAPERRAVILEAALRTFASRGYDGASMDEIAAAAGVSKAVVYDHVASKRELYMVLLDSIRSNLVAVVEGALAASDPMGEERVRIATDTFFRYVEQHPEASRLLILELRGANVSAIGRELEERLTVGIAATLGVDGRLFDGDVHRDRQLEILAELLKSAVQGLAGWWFRHPETPREELVEHAVAVIWPAIEQLRAS